MKTHFIVETWILFRKNDEVVSNVVMEAYGHYEDMEFGEEKDEKSIGDPQRHIKLINIAKKKVPFSGCGILTSQEFSVHFVPREILADLFTKNR